MTPNGNAEPAADSASAPQLGGRYELRDLLGTGGSGAVYRARDLLLERDVAVKLLHAGQDDIARARLRSEARIAGALAHPGVARLLDFGEDEGPAGVVPYLVMEHVPGRTLREVLRSGTRLSTEQVLRLLAQIADALAVVHAAGIVHRDLKPGNIMLTESGRAVLLDFGIARHHGGEPLTMTGTIVGTVDYISPEQAGGASATAASDLYALGTVAYEALTGLRPLNRDTQVSTLMAHAGTPMPPLPPSFPAGVRDLVAAMTALDPAARPAGAAAVAQWVDELLRDPARTRSANALATGFDAESGRGARREARPRVWLAQRRHLVAAACAALLVAAGYAFFDQAKAPVVAPAVGVTASTGPSAGADSSAGADPSAGATPSPAAVAHHAVAPSHAAVRSAAPKPRPAKTRHAGPAGGPHATHPGTHGRGHAKGHGPAHRGHGRR